jgi:hypothetical protein
VRWWHERRFERESREHQQQSDARTNQRISESYEAFPVRLLAIVSADLYVGGEIPKLDRHLAGFLPPGRYRGEGRDHVHEFLQVAEAKVGGGAGMHASFYNILESGWPTTQKVNWLPPEVESVHLLLRTLSTGIVLFGVFVIPSSYHTDLAERVFLGSHPSPQRREKGGTVTYTVDAAKSQALRRGLEGMLEFGMFPANAGLLGRRRYPVGSMAVWDVASLPDENDEHWRTLRRVLEMQDWHRWDGAQERLYAGMPIGDIGSLWDRQSGGWSLLTAEANHPNGKSAEKESLRSLRHELQLGIGEWFSWIVALQAAAEIGKQADRLRASLDRERKGAFRFLRVRTLEPLVDSLQECQYRLSRLKQATSVAERRYTQFPKMVERDVIAERRRQDASTKETSGPRSDAPPEAVTRTFGDALASWIETTIETALQETRLSLDRASTLVQLRTNAAMRAWTIILVALTLAVVVLTAAVALIALRTAH